MVRLREAVSLSIGLFSMAVQAGGSNYGVVPGALARVDGVVQEWPVPTPQFARDPAPGPDGAIYIAVMRGNRIARFDPRERTFREWVLEDGAQPHGLVVDAQGIVWYTGNGNDTIGRLDPVSGELKSYRVPGGGRPHTVVIGDGGILWFTLQGGQRVGRFDPASGEFRTWNTSGGPYGIAIDRQGLVWFCRLSGNMLGRLDPATGTIDDVPTGDGSGPRRMAVGPDGMLWVTAYGDGRLLKVDPAARRVVGSYPMPGGARGGPYAVTVDGAGRVWANEISHDTVALFDPTSESFRVISLPSRNVGIRKAVIDARGRYWYMGSHNGRLGVIE